MPEHLQPPKWDDERLKSDRQESIDAFITERLNENQKDYLGIFQECEEAITRLMDTTDNLTDLSGSDFVADPELIEPARQMAGPPISQDDFDTVARGNVTRRKNIEPEDARRAAEILLDTADPERFPWIKENRDPTDVERSQAITSTASVWAVQKYRTMRRVDASQEQEQRVVDRLDKAGMSEVELNQIESSDDLDQLPPGSFAHRVYMENSECDVAVRLSDGRLLAMEGKVSNSEVNSIKRLIHEVGNKAGKWRGEYGDLVIPAAFLSGVFKMKHLKEAQNRRNITIFWDHDLDPLIQFIKEAES